MSLSFHRKFHFYDKKAERTVTYTVPNSKKVSSLSCLFVRGKGVTVLNLKTLVGFNCGRYDEKLTLIVLDNIRLNGSIILLN